MKKTADSALLDFDTLDDLRDLLESDLAQVIDLFVNNSKEQMSTLASLFSEEAFRTMAEECHSLKGSCHNVGARAMASGLSQIESLARRLGPQSVPSIASAENCVAEMQFRTCAASAQLPSELAPDLQALLTYLSEVHVQTIVHLEAYLAENFIHSS